MVCIHANFTFLLSIQYKATILLNQIPARIPLDVADKVLVYKPREMVNIPSIFDINKNYLCSIIELMSILRSIHGSVNKKFS